MNVLELKLEYLGYDKPNGKILLGPSYNNVYNVINKLSEKDLLELKPITIDEMKKTAVKFYEKYFDLHDIFFAPLENTKVIMSDVQTGKIDELQAYKQYYELSREISPFELPIVLKKGDSMIGEVIKPLILLPKEFIPKEIMGFVPFSDIHLGDEITTLSVPTYIHEIAHTQQESNPGYAKSYFNKEVISIFLEKLSAYENDPTGNLLKVSERRRFMHIKTSIDSLKIDDKMHILTEEERLDCAMYIQSTLLAEKMFDMYLQEKKVKKREKYIYDIQDVFDGKQTVEDILEKRNITINQGKDLSLIKRHI